MMQRVIITTNKQEECVTMPRISCWDNNFMKPLRKLGCLLIPQWELCAGIVSTISRE